MSDLNVGCMNNKNVLTVCNIVMAPNYLQPNKSFYLSKRLLFRPNYITLLVTVNQMSRLGEAPHGGRGY